MTRTGFALLALALVGCRGDRASTPMTPASGELTPTPANPPRAPWTPAPGMAWQIQLAGEVDPSLPVAIYDVDLVDTPDATLAALRARGIRIICYCSAGTAEAYRSDLGGLPPEVLGKPLADWPDERWLDIRAPAVRELARRRLDLAVTRGCDGVDPDNVDAFANPSGLPLTADDQLAFNRFLAAEAHARGLGVGLKNDIAQIPSLLGAFDWAINEQCMAYDECDALAPFVRAGKPVFHLEYGDPALAERVCPDARARGFDTLVKRVELDAFRIACR